MLGTKTFSKFALINAKGFIKKDVIWLNKFLLNILEIFDKMLTSL